MNNISFKGLPNSARYVSKNIIVGAKQGLLGLKKLKNEEGVNLILDVRKKRFLSSFIGKMLSKITGIRRVEVPTTLGNGNIDINPFKKAAEIIENNKGGKTFLHCRHGKHRSVLVAAIAKMRAGEIKTKEELNTFLSQNKYFERKKKNFLIRLLKKDNVAVKINYLNDIKEKFIKLIMGT